MIPHAASTRRVAVVTGAESGIGRAAAVALARAGYDIGVAWHRDEAAGRETAELIERAGGRAALSRLDLAAAGEPASVVGSLAERLGGLDVLVNSAGIGHRAGLMETTEHDFRRIVDVDLTGAFLVAQAAARRMVEAGRGGRIVLISSVHEHLPLARSVAYTAAKHGVGGLTKSLALELAPHGITVNAVAPGAIATPMTVGEGADGRSLVDPTIPAGRLGRPDEVARVIVHLCAPEAGYATGSSYVVDGGMMLRRLPTEAPAGGRVRRRLAQLGRR